MKVRSVTVFSGIGAEQAGNTLKRAGELAKAVRGSLEQAGYEVQTTRLALPPVPTWAPSVGLSKFRSFVKLLDCEAADRGIDYLSLGPLLTEASGDPAFLDALPQIISDTERTFASAYIADMNQNVFSQTLNRIADIILAVSQNPSTGFGNLRFAALAHCPAGTPFFPAAYAKENDFSVALATESADLALQACSAAESPSDAMQRLQSGIERHAAKIEQAAGSAANELGAAFNGCDWSLATHPDKECSIVAAIEKLSGAKFGEWGTLTAVASITRALRRAKVKHVGFSGVFLPVMEDFYLAERCEQKSYDVQRLLLYSTVCGAGLDTIPLPGDVSRDAVAALLSDVASMASVLRKPLTVRLMPVPGLKAGEKTRFDFPFLINTTPLEISGNAPQLVKDSMLNLSIP